MRDEGEERGKGSSNILYMFLDVDGVKLDYFPSRFVSVSSVSPQDVGGAVSRCSFPQAFTGHGRAKRSRCGSSRSTSGERRRGNPNGMERARARVSGTVVPKYIVAVGRAGDRRGTRRTKGAIIGQRGAPMLLGSVAYAIYRIACTLPLFFGARSIYLALTLRSSAPVTEEN